MGLCLPPQSTFVHVPPHQDLRGFQKLVPSLVEMTEKPRAEIPGAREHRAARAGLREEVGHRDRRWGPKHLPQVGTVPRLGCGPSLGP